MADYKGSIELIGGLTQKNNGDFPLVHAKDVYQPTADTLPDGGIAEAGVMYFLGEVGSLSVGFPDTASAGDIVYISFFTGEIAQTVTFTTPNHAGLGDGVSPQPNHFCEIIGVWNGEKWMCVTNEVPR